jgi:hypothetical protein
VSDTEYTKGFKAGMRFREQEIIKLLESKRPVMKENGKVFFVPFDSLIALIKAGN